MADARQPPDIARLYVQHAEPLLLFLARRTADPRIAPARSAETVAHACRRLRANPAHGGDRRTAADPDDAAHEVIVNTAEQLRAHAEQLRKSCHKLKSGVLACTAGYCPRAGRFDA